jgi:hypothetical protein
MDDIKVITIPDIIFDQSTKILVIQPSNDLKDQIQDYILNIDKSVSVYYYMHNDKDLKWLFSVLELVDLAVIDLDGCDAHLSHFLGYILSKPYTYYRTYNMTDPWDLINKNKFFDIEEIRKI